MAQFRSGKNEWRINGSTTVPGPGNSIHIHGGDPTGPMLGEVPVDALGNWEFRERNSATLPGGATTITAHSTGGAIIAAPLDAR